jgi:hypothetical protein
VKHRFKDGAMRRATVRSTLGAGLTALCALSAVISAGCASRPPEYGTEFGLTLPAARREIWAVAPAINLSGQREVDPLLQADLVYGQLQQVRGLTVVPVNRVAEVYAALRIEQVQSAEQAALVCDLLACDALLVPTVTAYDPYNPPKLGASLHLFRKPGTYARPANVDPRDLVRRASPPPQQSVPSGERDADAVQAVGMFDAANGSVRAALFAYARGRHDPLGPMGPGEYLASMDRFGGFVYYELADDLLKAIRARR